MNDDCEKSIFGCCQHSKTDSYGPFQLGCTLNCNFTRYGCCPDNVTIAKTETLDNCLPLCASTPHGCCNDNSTATDPEKSNCLENAKKIDENLPNNEEECEEEVNEGSGNSPDEIEGSGDQIETSSKSTLICKKKKKIACADTKYVVLPKLIQSNQ